MSFTIGPRTLSAYTRHSRLPSPLRSASYELIEVEVVIAVVSVVVALCRCPPLRRPPLCCRPLGCRLLRDRLLAGLAPAGWTKEMRMCGGSGGGLFALEVLHSWAHTRGWLAFV